MLLKTLTFGAALVAGEAAAALRGGEEAPPLAAGEEQLQDTQYFTQIWPNPAVNYTYTSYGTWDLQLNVTASWPPGLPTSLLAPLQSATTTVTFANTGSTAGIDWSVLYSFGNSPVASGTLEPGDSPATAFVKYLGPTTTAGLLFPYQLQAQVKNRNYLAQATAAIAITQTCPDGSPIGNDFCTSGRVWTYVVPEPTIGALHTYYVTGGCANTYTQCQVGEVCCANGAAPDLSKLINCGSNTNGAFCYDCSKACYGSDE